MKAIYTHSNILMVGVLKSQLENIGIDVIVKNDLSSGAAGELAPTDAWPELWLVNDEDFARVADIVERFVNPVEKDPWACSACGEPNDVSFECCWQCQEVRVQAS